jgi:hypothetical protein
MFLMSGLCGTLHRCPLTGGGNDRGTDGNMGNWGTGTGGARLVLFSCSRLVWVLENAFQGLFFSYRHLYSIKSDPFLYLLVECMLGLLEGLDDSFICRRYMDTRLL